MKTFENYIENFDYSSIPAMKMSSKNLIELLPEGNIQLIDVRFKEEYDAWKVFPFKNIPLNELPQRLSELDPNQLIITACPASIRSNIAMHYLMTKGFNVRFLSDGLSNFINYLMGSDAKKFQHTLNK
jgi:rhodanese-related sulfurtransferase